MCGIGGFYSVSDTISSERFYAAHSKISHRGPDDEGFFFVKNGVGLFASGLDTDPKISSLPEIQQQGELSVVLGHRRLSIIDLSEAGHQPFEIGSKVLCYNGEIYNYLELKEELVRLGVEFKTSTDTEVFLAAYIQWGDAAFKKFNGMWGAAIYDKASNELVLTRDRFGVKPLYYHHNDTGIYFSSELKYFKELGLVGCVDRQSVYQYLRYSESDYGERTFFQDILQLEPGSFLRINGSEKNINYFWGESDLRGGDGASDQVVDTFIDSLKLRLRSDVPVGSLLSGGIDSSLIVGCINELQGLSGFQSYSAVFNEEEFSEKKYIDKNAGYLGFSPNYIFPEPGDLAAEIEELVYVQEMPFRSLSVLSQYLIYKEVARQKKVTVLLNGQGADEIFTGYTDHYSFYFWSLLKRLKFKKLVSEFNCYCTNKNLSTFRAISKISKDLISARFSSADKYKIFKQTFVKERVRVSREDFSPLKKKLYRDLSFSALREYLRYEDRNSMNFSLESRLPFLDYRLVKLAFSLRDSDCIVGGFTKKPIRDACSGRVHDSIVSRVDKTGFVSPQELWQKKELKSSFDEAFLDIELNGLFDFLDESRLSSLYEQYVANEFSDWAFIWRVYCLYKWKQVWLEGDIG